MEKSMYNLQIPISKDLAIKLKELAKQDERSLRTYCKIILQQYVDGNINREVNNNNSNNESVDFDFDSLD